MFKAVFLVMALLMSSFLFVFLHSYIPYLKLELSSNKFSYLFLNQSDIEHGLSNSTRKLTYLTELTSFPLIGTFFQEEKIAELVLLAKFNQTIQDSNKALENPIHSRSFTIWYYKALSECYLRLLQECEASLSKASLYSNHYTHPYVQQIYELLKRFSIAEKATRKIYKMTEQGISAYEIVEMVSREANSRRRQLEEL